MLCPPSNVRADEFKNKLTPEPPSLSSRRIENALAEFDIFRITLVTPFDASVRCTATSPLAKIPAEFIEPATFRAPPIPTPPVTVKAPDVEVVETVPSRIDALPSHRSPYELVKVIFVPAIGAPWI